jgi:hypothetical protein
MERFKEHCRRNREDKLEKKLEKRDRQALKERKRIRRENLENHCRRVLQRQEQRRFRRAMRHLRQLADQRAREREIHENERHRLLQAAASSEEIELERSQPEQRDNSPVLVAPATTNHSSSDTADLNFFLLLALELAVLSVLTVVLLVVLFLLDILLGSSSCKSFFAKLSSSDCAQQCRENLSFCNEYCKRNYCEFVCVSVCLCLLVFVHS